MNRDLDRSWLGALALNVLIVAVLAVVVPRLAEGDPMWPASDHINYIAMWSDLSANHVPPFCYRLLQPALAASLPLDRTAAFTVVTVVMLIGTGLLLFVWLRRRGASARHAMAGVMLFHGLNWCTKYLVYDVYRPEPPLFFFVMLALVFHSYRRWWAVGLALAAATLAKESALFVVPWVVVDRWLQADDGRWRDVLELSLPALIVVAALRVFVTPSSPYQPIDALMAVAPERLTSGLPSFLRGLTVGTWGVLVPVAMAFAPRSEWRRFAAAAPFVLLVVLQPLVATNVDRLVTLAFPVTVALAVRGLARIESRTGAGPATTLILSAVPLLLVLFKSGWHSPAPEQRLLFLAVATALVSAAHRWISPRTA